ncbi:hypothetical protein SLOPH_1797 [Spraguea lophii 42_110]|uniref:Uncharacterized protein n=1 Tax=Spraguea lophii (strain 42_110) TaxID=1358809 RepID=S7WAK6_SPRLO|nr:hypothetical protein SLOPH_1797 [Spraguea lophii 42_110]
MKIFYENFDGIEYLLYEYFPNFKYFKIRTEEINNKDKIFKIKSNLQFNEPSKMNLKSIFSSIICKYCNNCIEIENSDRLPSIGWEELVDHWSCHNNEFKSLLNLKPKPRTNSILYSNFYFLINSINYCCWKENKENQILKIFYNEINTIYDDKDIIYIFLEEYFKNNDILQINNVIIKFYNESIIAMEENDENNGLHEYFYKSLKVGYKIVNKKHEKKEINEYYRERIIALLNENKIDRKIDGYILSFIFSDKTKIKEIRK